MAGLVYFDTDAFHRIGQVFAAQSLSAELRERVVVSPITVLEGLSHLTLAKNEEILKQIQAIHNWVNPNAARLLPWPSEAIARFGFQKATPDDEFTRRIEEAINTCLATESADELRDSAARMKDALDKMKASTGQQFKRLVEGHRRMPLSAEEFSEAWVHGIATRVRVDPKSRPVAEIVAALSAYHEFEEERLKVAASNLQYVPRPNDLLDSEQLVYLGDPALRFLTCDGGYFARIKKSPQAKQICRASHEELADGARVEELLRRITA